MSLKNLSSVLRVFIGASYQLAVPKNKQKTVQKKNIPDLKSWTKIVHVCVHMKNCTVFTYAHALW